MHTNCFGIASFQNDLRSAELLAEHNATWTIFSQIATIWRTSPVAPQNNPHFNTQYNILFQKKRRGFSRPAFVYRSIRFIQSITRNSQAIWNFKGVTQAKRSVEIVSNRLKKEITTPSSAIPFYFSQREPRLEARHTRHQRPQFSHAPSC